MVKNTVLFTLEATEKDSAHELLETSELVNGYSVYAERFVVCIHYVTVKALRTLHK